MLVFKIFKTIITIIMISFKRRQFVVKDMSRKRQSIMPKTRNKINHKIDK